MAWPEPEAINAIWDKPKGGVDKYTIFYGAFDYQALSLSHDAHAEQGISEHCDAIPGEHLGVQIQWEDLPDNIQAHIIERLAVDGA